MSEVTIITFVIEALIIVWAFHRSGFMPFPHIFMIYIVGAQLFMWLNVNRIIYYHFLDIISTGAYITYFDKMLMLLFVFFLGAAACTPKARLDVGSNITPLELDFRLLVAIIALLYIRLFAHVAYLDLSSLWFTNTYIEMGQILVRENWLGTFLSQSARAFGLLTSESHHLSLWQAAVAGVSCHAPTRILAYPVRPGRALTTSGELLLRGRLHTPDPSGEGNRSHRPRCSSPDLSPCWAASPAGQARITAFRRCLSTSPTFWIGHWISASLQISSREPL